MVLSGVEDSGAASVQHLTLGSIVAGNNQWERMLRGKQIIGVRTHRADLAGAETEQPGVIPSSPLILAESKIAAPRHRNGRVSGFLVPRIEPLKVSRNKFGTAADIYRQGRSVGPITGTAGVVVTNPASQPGGIGTGYITVVWTPSQAGFANQANWWVNAASPHPIPTNTFPLSAGNATVTFGPLAGHTPPAPVGIHIWKGQVTTLTVTYG